MLLVLKTAENLFMLSINVAALQTWCYRGFNCQYISNTINRPSMATAVIACNLSAQIHSPSLHTNISGGFTMTWVGQNASASNIVYNNKTGLYKIF